MSKIQFFFNNLLLITITILLISCQKDQYPQYFEGRNTVSELPHLNDTTLLVIKISKDSQYGRIPEKPIFLGVINHHEGGRNRSKFFNSLLNEHKDVIEAYRIKSCCPYRTLNSHTIGKENKFGLLDVWVVTNGTYKSQDTLYVNPYDQGALIAPFGFLVRK